MRHRTRKHHRKYQRGGKNDETMPELGGEPSDGGEPSGGEPEVVVDSSSPPQSGGRRGGRRKGGRSSRSSDGGSRKGGRSSRSSDGGSRKGGRRRGGRRSHKGGFMSGIGELLSAAVLPLGLSYYTITRSRKNRNKKGGRDDIA